MECSSLLLVINNTVIVWFLFYVLYYNKLRPDVSSLHVWLEGVKIRRFRLSMQINKYIYYFFGKN